MAPTVPRAPGVAVSLALGAVLAAAAGLDDEQPWPLAVPAPAVSITPAHLDDRSGLACGECHAAIVDEWAGSAHALSWVDEHYQAAIADRSRPELCHGCHIPEPLVGVDGLADRARARTDALHLGVACDACHLGPDGAQLGPRGAATDAHATARSPLFVDAGSNSLCSVCHASNIGPVVGLAADFAEAGQADRGRSCVGCHMAPLEPGTEGGSARRSHAIQTPRDPSFLARAFALSPHPEGGLAIANRAGHRVPGLKGRSVTFVVQSRDADGALLASAEHTIDARAYLPVDGALHVPLPPGGASLAVKGLHTDPRAEAAIVFVDVTLPVAR